MKFKNIILYTSWSIRSFETSSHMNIWHLPKRVPTCLVRLCIWENTMEL